MPLTVLVAGNFPRFSFAFIRVIRGLLNNYLIRIDAIEPNMKMVQPR